MLVCESDGEIMPLGLERKDPGPGPITAKAKLVQKRSRRLKIGLEIPLGVGGSDEPG